METKYKLEHPYEVRSYEADIEGLASVTTLCRYLDDVAGRHANALGFGMSDFINQNITWMLSRLHFKLVRRPKVHSKVMAETWPSRLDRLFALREVQLSDDEGVFMTACSAWMIIDLKRRRPLRPQPYFEDIPLSENPIFDYTPEKLDFPEAPAEKGQVKVPFSSIDLNKHVTNTVYLKWALDQLDREFYEQNRIIQGDINFLNEAFLGDKLTTHTIKENNSVFQSIKREEEELCRLRFKTENL